VWACIVARRFAWRKFVGRCVYVPPAILTLAAAPAFAKAGSEKKPREPDKVEKPGKPPAKVHD
jgi:hypothetical protein